MSVQQLFICLSFNTANTKLGAALLELSYWLFLFDQNSWEYNLLLRIISINHQASKKLSTGSRTFWWHIMITNEEQTRASHFTLEFSMWISWQISSPRAPRGANNLCQEINRAISKFWVLRPPRLATYFDNPLWSVLKGLRGVKQPLLPITTLAWQ